MFLKSFKGKKMFERMWKLVFHFGKWAYTQPEY